MKSSLILMVLTTIFTCSYSSAQESVKYDDKFKNFDGSTTYTTPKVGFDGYYLPLAEVFRARSGVLDCRDEGMPDWCCTDYSDRVSKTSETVCKELGHAKLIGSKNVDASEFDTLFVSTAQGLNSDLTSVPEYQEQYSVYGKKSWGNQTYETSCSHLARKVAKITCK